MQLIHLIVPDISNCEAYWLFTLLPKLPHAAVRRLDVREITRAVFDEVGLPARGFVFCCFNWDAEKPRDGFMIAGGRSVAMLLAPMRSSV